MNIRHARMGCRRRSSHPRRPAPAAARRAPAPTPTMCPARHLAEALAAHAPGGSRRRQRQSQPPRPRAAEFAAAAAVTTGGIACCRQCKRSWSSSCLTRTTGAGVATPTLELARRPGRGPGGPGPGTDRTGTTARPRTPQHSNRSPARCGQQQCTRVVSAKASCQAPASSSSCFAAEINIKHILILDMLSRIIIYVYNLQLKIYRDINDNISNCGPESGFTSATPKLLRRSWEPTAAAEAEAAWARFGRLRFRVVIARAGHWLSRDALGRPSRGGQRAEPPWLCRATAPTTCTVTAAAAPAAAAAAAGVGTPRGMSNGNFGNFLRDFWSCQLRV